MQSMSAELNFFRFLKKLPPHNRNLYILLQSYRDCLSKFNNLDTESQLEAFSVLSEVFETDIINLIESHTGLVESPNPASPIYEAIRNERAEVSKSSSNINKPDRLAVIKSIDKQFDDTLGEWGSSFSTSGDDEPLFTPETSDSIKRLSNASDLSSHEDNISPSPHT
jgi:hypothetical protein